MSEADAQVWQSRRRDAVVIPLDVVAQHQAIDIRLVENHSRSGFGYRGIHCARGTPPSRLSRAMSALRQPTAWGGENTAARPASDSVTPAIKAKLWEPVLMTIPDMV